MTLVFRDQRVKTELQGVLVWRVCQGCLDSKALLGFKESVELRDPKDLQVIKETKVNVGHQVMYHKNVFV